MIASLVYPLDSLVMFSWGLMKSFTLLVAANYIRIMLSIALENKLSS